MKKHRIVEVPKTNSLLAVSIYVCLSLSVLVYGVFIIRLSLKSNLIFIIFGLLLFTLVEYLLHRFLYHSGKDYKDEANWQYKVHGIHHDHPKEKGLLAMPIVLAILLGSFFFFLFYIILKDHTYFFWPGFFLGYALYLFIHYKIHSQKPPKNVFKYLWKHHNLHHYVYENKAFGVSSPLWDIIFGTMPPKKRIHAKKETKLEQNL
jgi:sterol desaturase/sphingolipid hydroxylase (fatty acid hydroxylase superfamily)